MGNNREENNMRKQTWKAAVSVAAICVAAAMPSWAAVVTNTVDGVKWVINTSGSNCGVGALQQGGTISSASSYASHRAIATSAYSGKPLVIPASFTVGNTTYTTTQVGNRAFYSCTFSSLVVPASVGVSHYFAYLHCNKLKDVCFPGKVTVSSGTQSFSTPSFQLSGGLYPFSNCGAVKFVFIGPNAKLSGTKANFKFANSSGVTFLVPRRSDNTTWNGLEDIVGGTSPNVIYYGPTEECGYDFWMGADTVTAVPRTLEALAAVNSYASTFKTSFFLDTRYAITNSIGTLTSDIYSGAGMDVMGEGEITFGLAAAFTGGVTASGTATVSVNAGCRPGNGAVTLDDTATLKVAQSGTVTLGGALTAANGTTLAFNFTEAATAPSLNAASVALPADGTVNVKVTADNNFAKGAYTLISGAGLTEGDLVRFTMNPKLSNDWRGRLSIVDGNLVLTVKPKPGFMLIVQ